jgi:predicted RNA-binding Zn ribbon-like protein
MADEKSPQLAEPGSPAIFLGKHTALDFLNSIASPVDVPIEWLGNGEAFIGWLHQAGLVPREALRALGDNAGPGEMDAIAVQARALREWFRGFVHKHRGKPLSPAALEELEPINRILAGDERHNQVVLIANPGKKPSPFSLIEKRKWHTSSTLLIPIAEAIAQLVSEEDFTYVKACEGHSCTVLFLDNTRRHARRWCSMSICGNRAKVAAFRARGDERGGAV